VTVPSSDLALPAPLLPETVVSPPPLGGKGGGQHSLAGDGGVNSDDWRESLAFCLLSVEHSISS
jgi:hypothetical protein